jgi:mannose-1-phosphate guanylyltransferase / phosphomannomutase
VKAVVMAGGEGSRLRPLTSRTPKPLVPIANRPVMHHIVALLHRSGFEQVIATVHYLADEIESYFGDGSDFGVSISYTVEDTPLGTAGAVKLAEHLLGDEDFLIISGDAMTDFDVRKLIAHHTKSQNDVTIALKRVSNPLEFGVVITDDRANITRFLEKPSWGQVFSDTINTGIYVLRPEIFNRMERDKVYDFSKDLFPRMLHEGKRLGGYIIEDYWVDVGNLQQYQQANYDAVAGLAHIEPQGVEIAPGVRTGKRCRIDPSATLIGPVILGADVQVGAGVTIEGPACIGDRSVVADRASIVRSVIWSDVYAGEDSSLTDCTIANRTIVKDRVTVSEGTVVGQACVIGSGATVRAHLKIWPEKTISSGSIVSMSLIYGIKWPGSLFGAVGVSGLANLEVTPEYAVKLGQAFGTSLKPGGVVTVSRDTHPVSRIMSRCLGAGLMSTGVNVDELRSYPLPLSRFEAHARGDGGVHVRISPNDPNAALFEFLDGNGLNIDKSTERKIENLFFREDFRRTPLTDVGIIGFPARSLERYTSAFLQALASSRLPDARFRVVIDYAYGNVSLVLPRILSSLGVESIALNAYFDEEHVHIPDRARDRHLEQLSDIVLSLKADVGILVDHDGETFSLVDDGGRIISGDRLFALLARMVAHAYRNARIAVPVTAPQAIEKIAEKFGATVIRTRSDRRAVMELAQQESDLAFAGGSSYEVVFPEMHPVFDALYGAAKVLDLLAGENKKLSQIVDELPSWYMASRTVSCPWEHKGRIMRALIDEQSGNRTVLLDGVRIGTDDGWVLVLPDSSDPEFRILAEGRSAKDAIGYVDSMSHHIEELVNT